MVEAMETLQDQGQGHVQAEVDMGRLNEGTQEVVKGWACVADQTCGARRRDTSTGC